MPRKFANQIATKGVVAPVSRGYERPDPPENMPAPAAAIWHDVVASMRPRWFSRETHEQLARYCNAMVECHRLETALAGADDVGSASYERISKQLNATAARALGYARALRITPLSNRENKIDGRDRSRSLNPKPWVGADDSPRKPWEDR